MLRDLGACGLDVEEMLRLKTEKKKKKKTEPGLGTGLKCSGEMRRAAWGLEDSGEPGVVILSPLEEPQRLHYG